MLELSLSLFFGAIRLVSFIVFGVFVGCLLENSSIGHKLMVLARPFERVSRLPASCASAFAFAFISPRTANAMLAELAKARRLRGAK